MAQHKQPSDLVIDYDAIAQALGSTHTHDHPPELLPFVHHTVDALLDRLSRQVRQRAWLIRCEPTTWDMAAAREHIRLDHVDMDECLRRARDAGRPPCWEYMIRQWFEAQNRTQATP